MARSPSRPQESDRVLVDLAVGGDKRAFAALVTRHRSMMTALARRMLRNQDQAEDAVQEAIVIALLSLHRLRNRDSFGPWLSGIALNVSRRLLHQTQPIALLVAPDHLDHPDDAAQPDEAAEATIIAQRVRAAVNTLPPGQRDATLLFYMQGRTHSETAAELQISVGAVKSRLHQARNALAPQLIPEQAVQEETPMPKTVTSPESWIDVSIADVRAELQDQDLSPHVVVLEDSSGCQLPIWIGPSEATSLAIAITAEEMPRPLTYEFAAGLVRATSAKVVEVRVTRLVEGVYYAVVIIDGPAGKHELDARPSDALNLAVVTEARIRVASEILKDPAATDRQEWKNYTSNAPQLASDMRVRLEKHRWRMDEKPPPA